MFLGTDSSVVATPATRAIAKQIVLDTQWDGADATLRLLPQVRPAQLTALVHLLAAAACTGEVPTDPPAARKPLLLSEDERRRAHARFVAGQRDPATRRGEQEYQRARRRIQRTEGAA